MNLPAFDRSTSDNPAVENSEVLSKGQQTANRIMDAAEPLFSYTGYDATSLRRISKAAGVTEPALYNHFKNKRALYEAVLDRALDPMSIAMSSAIAALSQNPAATMQTSKLPATMTDILAERPHIAALFQQALQGDEQSPGNQISKRWLDRLFLQGSKNLGEVLGLDQQSLDKDSKAKAAIQIIGIFNLVTGYFLSQRSFETLAEGSIHDEENLAYQKQFLTKMARVMLIG